MTDFSNIVCVNFMSFYKTSLLDGIGFSYLDSGASHVSFKANIIHAIKWIQVIRSMFNFSLFFHTSVDSSSFDSTQSHCHTCKVDLWLKS